MDIESNYPDLGKYQPKTMSKITHLNFGSPSDMKEALDLKAIGERVRERRKAVGLSQQALGELYGQSQSNVQVIESGGLKDPRIQCQDMAPHLRTTAEYLIKGTGIRDVGPPTMTEDQIAHIYSTMTRDHQEAISAQFAAYAASNGRKRKKPA